MIVYGDVGERAAKGPNSHIVHRSDSEFPIFLLTTVPVSLHIFKREDNETHNVGFLGGNCH